MRLRDKVAIVTGAGTGLGRAIALMFGRAGAKLVLAETDLNREMLAGLKKTGEYEALVKMHLLGRLGEPDDVAYATVYLASDEAKWITGVTRGRRRHQRHALALTEPVAAASVPA